MEINVRRVTDEYQEVNVTDINATIETGLLNHDESRALACELMGAASIVLYNLGLNELSDQVDVIVAGLED